MYNRYLSPGDAPYVPTEPPVADGAAQSGAAAPLSGGAPPDGGASPAERIQQLLGLGGRREGDGATPLRRLLARFHLEDVDTGDLLLLILLFFLLEERADDELLIALGLLLIL